MELTETGYIIDLELDEAIQMLDEFYMTAAKARGNGKSRMTHNYLMAWIKIKEELLKNKGEQNGPERTSEGD